MTLRDPRTDGRLARRLFSTGLLSDTKWRKLFQAIAKGYDPQPDHVVVKFVDVAEPKRMHVPFGLHPPRVYIDTMEFDPTELRAIEWLDVPSDIVGLLKPIGRPSFERSGTYTRVTGDASPW
ncbi:hypothetical protein [Aureimonas jatrophae]|nr:hypothetical protein [Aureimonas jatrophae]MBB3952578.1 hypothetical protein [Aureimonas jatrophae]